MWGLIIILFVVAVIANVTQDEIRHHWSRWFGQVVKSNFLLYWMKPGLSWHNKYISKNPLVTFLLSTVFVWLTDFWHFLKVVMLNCFFMIAILLIIRYINPDRVWWQLLMMMNICWGVLYEFFNGVYGLLSDKF